MTARHVHLDPLGGIAGDMFIAALLDAHPELAEGALAAMRAAGLPQDWRLALMAHEDGTLLGRRLVIEAPQAPGVPTGSFRGIRERLSEARLEAAVHERAIAIFTLLAEAEAAVHGVAVDDVHFHELADWDSVADVVGAAWLIERLAPCTWSSAPLPKGGGRMRTRHGWLPVPAPATARLLRGMAMTDDGVEGERVTPTGAAILRHLEAQPRLPPGAWRLQATGFGFGTRRLPGIPNALRVLTYEGVAQGRIDEQVAVIAFEVDDQSPEELAVGLERLRGENGVLDVCQLPVVGKKGRLGAGVQILARPEAVERVIDRCFVETSTLGLRWRLEARAVLARETVTVSDPEGEVAVKVVTRPDGVRTAKAEIDDVAGSLGQAGRARRRQAAEACALDEMTDEHRLEGG